MLSNTICILRANENIKLYFCTKFQTFSFQEFLCNLMLFNTLPGIKALFRNTQSDGRP